MGLLGPLPHSRYGKNKAFGSSHNQERTREEFSTTKNATREEFYEWFSD